MRARRTIEAGAGTQFDPIVVAAFQRCFARFLVTQSKYVPLGERPNDPLSSSSRELATAS